MWSFALIRYVEIALAAGNPLTWALWRRSAESVRPIDFYGQVVDQRGHPVEGARVIARISVFNPDGLIGYDPDDFEGRHDRTGGHQRFVTYTAHDGTFSIEGQRGKSLTIEKVSKEGYVNLPEKKWHGEKWLKFLAFGYSYPPVIYVPDRAKPAVIPLRRPDEPYVLTPSFGGSHKNIPDEPRPRLGCPWASEAAPNQ